MAVVGTDVFQKHKLWWVLCHDKYADWITTIHKFNGQYRYRQYPVFCIFNISRLSNHEFLVCSTAGERRLVDRKITFSVQIWRNVYAALHPTVLPTDLPADRFSSIQSEMLKHACSILRCLFANNKKLSCSAITEKAHIGNHFAVQGHSRSPILISIDNPCAISD